MNRSKDYLKRFEEVIKTLSEQLQVHAENWQKVLVSFLEEFPEFEIETGDKEAGQQLSDTSKCSVPVVADMILEVGQRQEALGNCQVNYWVKYLNMLIDTCDKEGEGRVCEFLEDVLQFVKQFEKIEDLYKLFCCTFICFDPVAEDMVLKVSQSEEASRNFIVKYTEMFLNMIIEMGDKVSAFYFVQGPLYHVLGKYQDAIKSHQKMLNIAAEMGNKSIEGLAYGRLGDVYRSLRKYQDAIDYYEKSLSILLELGDKAEFSQLLRYGQDIRKYTEKCLSKAKEKGDKEGEGTAYENSGTVHQWVQKFQDAFKFVSISVEIFDKLSQAKSFAGLGWCYREKRLYEENHPDSMNKSANYFKDALQRFEWIFDRSEERDHFKVEVMDVFVNTYNVLTQELIMLKKVEDALLISERGRVRVLGELLVSKYNLGQGHDSRSNIMRYDDVAMLLTNNKFFIQFFAVFANSSVASWCLSYQNPPVFHEAFDKMQVRAVVNCEDRSLDLLEENENEHENTDIGEEQKLLPGQANNEVPLESNGRQKNPRPRNTWKGEENCPDPLGILYVNLVSPAQQDLTQDQEEIVIIPHRILFRVPFAALRDPNTNLYLADVKRVRLAPSLTTLKALQESPADYHNRTGALIVGNPAVDEMMYKGEAKPFERLPGAEREAKEISRLIGVTPLIGAQATKEAIKYRLQEGVAVVHIAAHGSKEGWILLAPCHPQRRVPEKEDCVLTMKEVQESGCRAQLVVLSCCHSGRGKIKAEGVMGLTRAFLAAGARAVVASLWAVDDDATEKLMLSFYKHLKSGESASASLQQAMKELREIHEYDEPRYWAPFFLMGDDVTIDHVMQENLH